MTDLEHYRKLLANDKWRNNTLWILRHDAWLAHFDDTPDHAEAMWLETFIQESGHARPYDAVLTPPQVQVIDHMQKPLLHLIGNEYRRPVTRKLNACISLIRKAYWFMDDPSQDAAYADLGGKLSQSLPDAWPRVLSAANDDKKGSPFDNTPFPSDTLLPTTPEEWLITLARLAIAVKITDDAMDEGAAEAMSS